MKWLKDMLDETVPGWEFAARRRERAVKRLAQATSQEHADAVLLRARLSHEEPAEGHPPRLEGEG